MPRKQRRRIPRRRTEARPRLLTAWEQADTGGLPGLLTQPSFPGRLPAGPSHPLYGCWLFFHPLQIAPAAPALRIRRASPAPRRGTSSLSWAQPGSQRWKPSKISQESGFLCFYPPPKSEYSLKPNRSFVGMGQLPSSFLLIHTRCFIFPHSFAAYLSFPLVFLPFYFVTD